MIAMRRCRPVTSMSTGPSGAVGQRLRRLSEWAIASCFTAAVGCSIEPPGKLVMQLGAGLAPVRQMPCPDLLLVTQPVSPQGELDYIGVIGRHNSWSRSLLSDYGEPCKSAQDRDACLAAIERAIVQAPVCAPGAVLCKPFIVTTSQDEVVRHDTAESLRRVLGRVDTASEAVLFAQLYGLHAACAPESFNTINAGTLVQATYIGWRVQSRWSSCSADTGEQIIEVRSDGTSDGFERNVGDAPAACVSTGRRPAGLQPLGSLTGREPIAAFFAQCAQLEAASVPAFRRLAKELQRLGAPHLAAAATNGAQDEMRHTALMAHMAARYGARPIRPRVVAERCDRNAWEIAHENAVEGCVRETFGALIAWQQSALAADPLVARTMRGIAADETRHAELSWHVAGWLEPQLTATERKQLARARGDAIKQLERDIATNPLPKAAHAPLGWPSQAQQHALVQRLAVELNLG
jgi:hypothetical protein